ncbi:MAG: hypothetical protein NZO58_04050 [Gemmataceae bacterium]|nr:hypothetical protein [Gemmataceae bacterium]
MDLPKWRPLAALLALSLHAQPTRAQSSPPDVGFIFPAGGRQGTTFVVKLGGQYLEGPSGLHFSGTGIEAKILDHTRPLTPKEINALRQRLQQLEEKKDKSDADRKEIEQLRRKLTPPSVRPTPALAEIVTAEVTIDPQAPPGQRQVRLRANSGMSNPLVFVVGQLPEVTRAKQLIDPEVARPRPPEVAVTLPVVINSQIMPGEVERYRFAARKDQQLVFNARARALIPFLADAVPGYFQPTLTLYDANGKEVAYCDHFQHRSDPVFVYKVPRDGEYVLEIKDALYRGREDFVYRLEIGELPFITSIFPLGGRASSATTVALEGWNLPQTNLTLEAKEMKPGTLPLQVRAGELLSNSVPFAVDTLPEVFAAGTNTSIAAAQPVALPVIVNGRLTSPGSWHVYRLEGRKGQVVVAEVQARRLDSPLDAMLKITDAAGKIIAVSDDVVDKGQGLLMHHADAQLRVALPVEGPYFVHLGDGQGQAGAAYGYRLRLSPPRPDFELRVTPCSINAQPGATVTITVYALRRDGFNGDIDLFLTYQPVDFVLHGGKVPAGQDVVRVTLQVPTTVRPRPVDLVLEGRALIEGRKVVRRATPAEDVMQAFIYHHLVPAKELLVTVTGQARARFPGRLLDPGPIKLRAGATTPVRLAIPRAAAGGKIDLTLSDPPDGIILKKTIMNDDGAVLLLYADGEKVRPGLKGNLIVEAVPEAAKGGRARTPLGTLPAIPFEVLKVGR